MELFNQSQQEQYKKAKLDIKKYTGVDVEEKKKRVNDWFDRNRGISLDELKENMTKMHYDMVALANAFLQIHDILNYLYHIKTDSELIKDYYEAINRLDFNVTELVILVNKYKYPFGRNYIRNKIEVLISKDVDTMKFLIHFIADDTKITMKKSFYEEFEGKSEGSSEGES